ncbi:hypothetical protein [Gelatiniphilus marinus]|uniref:NIPSNAP domain-containing protein n=1 Tax=Gelatiniphilus marinus TaxID=1759464 RepID=A0ABW5JTC3_9FLAO
MKKPIFITILLSFYFATSQPSSSVSIIDFVQVLNKNKAEALFYYQNNWLQLRIKALEKGYIASYQLLETQPTAKTPYTFMLITTYKNNAQYKASETHFNGLIAASDGLKLLNEKKPNTFRKVILNHDAVKHWH